MSEGLFSDIADQERRCALVEAFLKMSDEQRAPYCAFFPRQPQQGQGTDSPGLTKMGG